MLDARDVNPDNGHNPGPAPLRSPCTQSVRMPGFLFARGGTPRVSTSSADQSHGRDLNCKMEWTQLEMELPKGAGAECGLQDRDESSLWG